MTDTDLRQEYRRVSNFSGKAAMSLVLIGAVGLVVSAVSSADIRFPSMMFVIFGIVLFQVSIRAALTLVERGDHRV